MMTEDDLERISAGLSTAPKCILIAEDNPADVYLIREALCKHEPRETLNLVVVPDGEQAIDYILRRGCFTEACVPDLIILDLNLPKNDGVDVLRCVRDQPHLASVPVVMLTSSDSPHDRSITQRLGANNFITKPSDLDAFMALGGTLMGYMEGHGSPPQLSS